MTIELNIWIDAKDTKNSKGPQDQKMQERKAGQFIKIAKHLNSLVIKDERERYWHFYAVGNGVFLQTTCAKDQQDIADRIERELKPLAASVSHKEDRPTRRDIRIDFYGSRDARDLPSQIRWEIERSQARKCQKCGRKIAPGDKTQWCPYCGHDMGKQEEDDQLTICPECPKDPQGGSIYHHSYKHCPRCGQKLQRLRDLQWWEYDLKEQDFLGGGKPLTEFTIGPEHMPAKKKNGERKAAKRPPVK